LCCNSLSGPTAQHITTWRNNAEKEQYVVVVVDACDHENSVTAPQALLYEFQEYLRFIVLKIKTKALTPRGSNYVTALPLTAFI
jgi:hypothetical protein